MATKTKKMKPVFPKPAPEFSFGTKTHLMADFDRYSSGSLAMTMEGCGGKVKDESGKEIGSIYAALGGGLVVHIGNRTWGVNLTDIFEAVAKIDAEYMKVAK